MNMLKLKNGSEEAEPLVRVTMFSLKQLFETKPIVAYELRELCKNSAHKLFGNSGDDLKALSLVQSDGRVHDSIRNIVLSAFDGEGLAMCMISPVAG
jgi:hypothetical protein